MRGISVRVLVLAIIMVFTASAAMAQSYDQRAMYDRMDRLERDLQTLQSQLARGGASSLVVTSPAAQNMGNGRVSAADGSISDRLDDLEEQLRQLTGKVEEATFRAQQAGSKLERFQADVDLRFKEINDQLHPVAAEAPAAAGDKGGVPPKNSAENAGLAPGPQNLGTISDKDLKKAQASPPPAAAAVPKDPKAAYDAAYALYQSNDYAGAITAFQGFLAKFPDHQFAPGAQYWVGQSNYAQKDYKTALSAFADGYKKFPTSTKAPDLLYMMSKSFAQLDKDTQACSAISLLFKNHPDMPDRLRKAAAADKVKLGC